MAEARRIALRRWLLCAAFLALGHGCPQCAATTAMNDFARKEGEAFVFTTPPATLMTYAREELITLGYQVPPGQDGNRLDTSWLDNGSMRLRYEIRLAPESTNHYRVVAKQTTQWHKDDGKTWGEPEERSDGNFTWALIEKADPARFQQLVHEGQERAAQAAASCNSCIGTARTVEKHLPSTPRKDNPLQHEFDEQMKKQMDELHEIQRELHLEPSLDAG